MPIIQPSAYNPSFFFRFTHINTIFPALFRKPPSIDYQRENIASKDGDVLNLDWSRSGHNKLVICFHGLEGNGDRPYIRGMLGRFLSAGWDGLAFNFRSCAGEDNKSLQTYNMGATADVHCLIEHVLSKGYETIVLVGFSLGGNQVLKYMGEGGAYLPKEIKAAVAISVPCYIPTANIKIDQLENRLYLNRFIKTLNEKMLEKKRRFPEYISYDKKLPKNFQEFDARFTAPVHGYANAMDYWESCSSLHFLENISRPTLLINALDDTFLSEECYPCNEAKESEYFFLETPKHGGHCGFYSQKQKNSFYWSENRAFEFIESYL